MNITSRRSDLAASLCAIMILSFMTGILPFFGLLVEQAGMVWRLAYYGFWIVALGPSVALFLCAETALRGRLMSVLALAGLMIVVSIGHPIDGLMKNYTMIVLQLVIFTLLAATTRPGALLKLGLWIVILNAIGCLIDIMFPVGFSNTLGRAAGLMINPNVAALSLLLGASATFVVVPLTWRYSYIVLIAAAVFTTMSRSTMILGTAVIVGSIAFRYAHDFLVGNRALRIVMPDRRALLAVAAAFVWIFSAALMNDRLPVAASSSFGTGKVVFDMIDKLNISFENPVGDQSAVIAALGESVEELGDTNSMMARKYLMLRALFAFRTGPWNGSGLSYAHELAPHNTFLLFAMAFGYPGLFLSCAILIYAAYASGWRHMELPLALGGAMTVSHDILMPVLVAPLVIGFAFHLANRDGDLRPAEAPRFLPLVWSLAVASGIGIMCAVTLARPVETAILAKNVHSAGDAIYLALVPAFDFSGLLRAPEAKQILFEEYGTPLKPVSSAEQASGAPGVFDVRDGYLIQFSPTDHTDPRTENHGFGISFQPVAHRLAFLLIGVMALWALAYTIWVRRGAEPWRRESHGVSRVRSGQFRASQRFQRLLGNPPVFNGADQ